MCRNGCFPYNEATFPLTPGQVSWSICTAKVRLPRRQSCSASSTNLSSELYPDGTAAEGFPSSLEVDELRSFDGVRHA